MGKQRIISAFIVIPIIYLFVRTGGLPFFICVSSLSIYGLLEYFNMCNMEKIPTSRWWASLITFALMLNAFFVSKGQPLLVMKDLTGPIIALLVIGQLVILLIKSDLKHGLSDISFTVMGVMYVGWLAMHAILLREIKPFGFQYVLIVFVVTWISDAGAYYIGGKFSPRVLLHAASPNKSWAGALGSVLTGTFCMIAAVKVLNLDFISVGTAAILGSIIGSFAVMGDLAESLIKRNLNQKDSGVFMPGHGGVLDRIDSLLFTVPLMYYFVRYFVR